jgi:adenylate kinase
LRLWVLIGAPGAGKGTQARLLSERLGVPHIASGDLFRSHITRGTELGREVEGFLREGALVPDALTVRMIEQRLAEPDAADGAILDGFPRTRPQAQALDELLARRDGRVAGALYIDIDRDVLLRRLSGRWLCRASDDHVYHEQIHPPRKKGVCDIDGSPLYQRDDDRPATIRARFERQLPPMFEVVDHYAEQDVLSTVDGDKPIAEVTDALLRAIAAPAR